MFWKLVESVTSNVECDYQCDTAHFQQNNRSLSTHTLWMDMTCVSSLRVTVTAILPLDADPCLVYKHKSRHSLYWTRMVRECVHREIIVFWVILQSQWQMLLAGKRSNCNAHYSYDTIPYMILNTFELWLTVYLQSYNQYLQLYF